MKTHAPSKQGKTMGLVPAAVLLCVGLSIGTPDASAAANEGPVSCHAMAAIGLEFDDWKEDVSGFLSVQEQFRLEDRVAFLRRALAGVTRSLRRLTSLAHLPGYANDLKSAERLLAKTRGEALRSEGTAQEIRFRVIRMEEALEEALVRSGANDCI